MTRPSTEKEQFKCEAVRSSLSHGNVSLRSCHMQQASFRGAGCTGASVSTRMNRVQSDPCEEFLVTICLIKRILRTQNAQGIGGRNEGISSHAPMRLTTGFILISTATRGPLLTGNNVALTWLSRGVVHGASEQSRHKVRGGIESFGCRSLGALRRARECL